MLTRRRAVFFRYSPALMALVLAATLAGCAPPAAPPPAAPAPVAPPPKPHLGVPQPPPLPLPPAPSAKKFHEISIVLYQPDAVMKARLGDDPAPLAAYIRKLEHAGTDVLATAPPSPGFQAALVIALKPNGASRAWLVTRAKLPPGLAARLVATAKAVPPPAVQNGPVAFAIIFDAFGGGGKPVVDAAHPIPIPPEWRKGVSPSPMPQGPGPAPLSR